MLCSCTSIRVLKSHGLIGCFWQNHVILVIIGLRNIVVLKMSTFGFTTAELRDA
jgi:hypothetical protein